MEKCPRCGQWTVALNSRREVLVCRNIDCDYEKHVNVSQYLKSNNKLQQLLESPRRNGKNGKVGVVARS